jgi:predicted nucleic acid-binding protein
VIVVIDTNVWISALQFAKRRGTPTLALERAMSEDVIATCDEIDAEIVRGSGAKATRLSRTAAGER